MKTNFARLYLVVFAYQQHYSTASNPSVCFSYQRWDSLLMIKGCGFKDPDSPLFILAEL